MIIIIREILIMANFWQLLPPKATICDFLMEDSFLNHSVLQSLRSGFEIKIREIYLSSGFEIRNSSNFAEFKIRTQDSRLWRQNFRFGFDMRGDSVESENLKIRYSLLICRIYISASLFWVILPGHETTNKYIGFPFTIITVQFDKILI